MPLLRQRLVLFLNLVLLNIGIIRRQRRRSRELFPCPFGFGGNRDGVVWLAVGEDGLEVVVDFVRERGCVGWGGVGVLDDFPFLKDESVAGKATAREVN